MLKEDEVLYELIKDKYSVEEALSMYKELYENNEDLSEEAIVKRGIVSLILEHEGLLEDLQDKIYKKERGLR